MAGLATTYIGSTLMTGSGTLTQSTDGGYVVVSQVVPVTSLATGLPATGTLTLPSGSQIIDVYIDKTVLQVEGAGTATTLPCTVGTSAGGAQYIPSVDMWTTVRSTGVPTVATLLAMSNIGTNTVVYCTIDPNGTILTTQAVVNFTVVYAQK